MRHEHRRAGGPHLLVLLGMAAATLIAGHPEAGEPPYAPDASMATMQLEPGYSVSLVASEPDVASPVAIDVDESGRMFVVEMPGYPLDTRPTGRIRLLDDTDGDGRYDRSRIFADGLVLPTGVMRWRKGVLVTSAPDLLYLEDTDDDGRADARHVVLTGFPFTNPQHTVNTPVLGPDNWIYLAAAGHAEAVIYKDLFGDRGRPLTWPEHPDRPALDPRGRGVRLRIDRGLVEPLSSDSQYGHGFDRWGHYFTNDNSNHARHEVMAARHLARNPGLLLPTAMEDISDHGSAAQVFPVTKRPTFELLTEFGEFTSACAITPYEGGAFGGLADPSASWLFAAEPVHNLVHRDVLAPSGATFVARRSDEAREFLAAGDSWFRPVFLYVGPDGALYVVDYYRARIEHPEWSASDLQNDPAPLYQGQDRGRIYRIAPAGQPPPARRVALGAASDEALVAELSNPNLWWRRTAQRLLVERASARAGAQEDAIGRDGHAALLSAARGQSPVGRFHALWALDALDRLGEATILAALADPTPGVREAAVQLAESRLRCGAGLQPCAPGGFAERLVAMEQDPDPRVRFAVLAALGSVASDRAAAARERMLLASVDDRWMQAAALSAGSAHAGSILARVTEPGSPVIASRSPGRAALVEQVASMAVRAEPAVLKSALDRVRTTSGPGDAWWRAASLRGVAGGVGRSRETRARLAAFEGEFLSLYDDPSPDVRRAALELLRASPGARSPAWAPAVARALAVAAHPGKDAAVRADAIALVSLDGPERRIPWFERFLGPGEPEAVQVEAVQALGRVPAGPSSLPIGRTLLARWAEMTPAVRREAAGVLIGNRARVDLLLDAMRRGTVQAWTLDFWQKRDLVMHDDAKVRDVARALLEEDPRQRAATIRRYAAALDLAGDAAKGREVFTRVCAACHRLGAEAGGDLGPDLATVRHRPPLGLLGDILVPSQSIAQHFETYVVRTKGGGTEAGVLGTQTPDTITLRQGQGRSVTIHRAEIRSLAAAPQSSMPADLDKAIGPDEMADLLTYIRGQ